MTGRNVATQRFGTDIAATSGLGNSAMNVSMHVAALPGHLHWRIFYTSK
jgi:hypothetical protein